MAVTFRDRIDRTCFVTALLLATACGRTELMRGTPTQSTTGNDASMPSDDAQVAFDGGFNDAGRTHDPGAVRDAGSPQVRCPRVRGRAYENGDVCWDIFANRDAGDVCQGPETAVIDNVTLVADCLFACEDDTVACRFGRSFYYDRPGRSCIPEAYCDIAEHGYKRFYYLPCVTAQDADWDYRKGPPLNECDALHPGWDLQNGSSMNACAAACEADSDCVKYRQFDYNGDTGTCIINASCTPVPLGFSAYWYTPHCD